MDDASINAQQHAILPKVYRDIWAKIQKQN